MTASTAAAGAKAGVDNRIAIVGVLTLINAFSMADRMMIGALVPGIREEFDLSDSEIGLLVGVSFSILYAVAVIPLARYADRGNRRRLIAASVAVWSGMTMLCGMANSMLTLFLARIGVGVGEGGTAPAAVSLFSDLYSPKARPLVLGVYGAGASLGVFLGLGLGGWIGAEWGWRTAFFVMGAPGLLLALIALIVVKEPPRISTEQHGGSLSFVPQLAKNIPYVLVATGFSLGVFSVLGMGHWLPSFFVRTHGVPAGEIAIWFGTLFGLGMVAGQLTGGALGSYMARKNPASLTVPVVASLLAAPCYCAVLWAPDTRVAIGLTAVSAFLGGLFIPSCMAAMQTLVEASVRATAAAVSQVMMILVGLGLGALLVGVASDLLRPMAGEDSLRWALTFAQLLTVVAAGCFVFSMRASANRRKAG